MINQQLAAKRRILPGIDKNVQQAAEPGEMMKNRVDNRAFERFLLEFEMEVSAESREGKKSKEKVMLKDISGGGAKFLSRADGGYYPGQSLDLSIHLPGSPEVRAGFRGRARVVRTRPARDVTVEGKSREWCVVIQFETRLQFERLDREAPTGRDASGGDQGN